jgi:hypothetical protein
MLSTLLNVAFGHHDLQTLPCQTYFCGDLSKNELNNPRSLEELKHIIELTVDNIDLETLCKLHKTR